MAVLEFARWLEPLEIGRRSLACLVAPMQCPPIVDEKLLQASSVGAEPKIDLKQPLRTEDSPAILHLILASQCHCLPFWWPRLTCLLAIRFRIAEPKRAHGCLCGTYRDHKNLMRKNRVASESRRHSTIPKYSNQLSYYKLHQLPIQQRTTRPTRNGESIRVAGRADQAPSFHCV